jgi:hypothetical protein
MHIKRPTHGTGCCASFWVKVDKDFQANHRLNAIYGESGKRASNLIRNSRQAFEAKRQPQDAAK